MLEILFHLESFIDRCASQMALLMFINKEFAKKSPFVIIVMQGKSDILGIFDEFSPCQSKARQSEFLTISTFELPEVLEKCTDYERIYKVHATMIMSTV